MASLRLSLGGWLADPPGWCMWALETRNAIVHRPRQLSANFPRERKIDLLIVTDDPTSVTRFDPYLRRNPWQADLGDLSTGGSMWDVWLREPAAVTMTGMRQLLNELVEGVFDFLLDTWVKIEESAIEAFPSPAGHWRMIVNDRSGFCGFAPPGQEISLKGKSYRLRERGTGIVPAAQTPGSPTRGRSRA